MPESTAPDSSEDRPRIRDARAEEIDQVALLIRDAYQEYQASIPAEVWEGYARDIMDVRGRLDVTELIVAEHKGSLVGAVTFYPNTAPTEQGGWPSGWTGIRLLAVLPDGRGLGIGRSLMDECLRRSRQLGAHTLGLHTTELMAVARGMYERMGFIRVPEYDFHPGPTMVVMAYRLEL